MGNKQFAGMHMPDWEIVERYKDAKDRDEMIGILAELNDCKKKDIIDVLQRVGMKVCHHSICDDFSITLGSYIDKGMRDLGISNFQLAREMEVSPRMIQSYRSGAALPPTRKMFQMVFRLGISIDSVMADLREGGVI